MTKYIKTTFLSVLALSAFAVITPAANAQEGDDRGFSIGGRGSHFDPKDGDGQWSGGAQLRFFLSDTFALEGSADFRRDEYDTILGETEVQTIPVQASILGYLIKANPVGVFFLAGPGWYYTRIEPPSPFDDKTDHRFGFHAGGGVEVRLNESWSIDGTYRHIWLEEFESQDSSVSEKEFDDSGEMITVGLNLSF